MKYYNNSELESIKRKHLYSMIPTNFLDVYNVMEIPLKQFLLMTMKSTTCVLIKGMELISNLE